MNAANMLTSLRDSFSQMGYYVMISALLLLLLLLSCPARAQWGIQLARCKNPFEYIADY